MEAAEVKLDRLANYCMRKADEDTRVSKYQGMSGRFMNVYVGLSAKCSFETPEIMAISDEMLSDFYKAEPKLERFRRYLTNMRRRNGQCT